MDRPLCLLAAKVNRDKGTWLSLSQHLADTEGVMKCLLDSYVAPSVSRATGLDDDSFRNIALFVAATHDIGKATSAFQIKMCDALPGYKAIIEENGFSADINGSENKSPHALAGASILEYCFGIDPSICEIIASHHGKPPGKARETKARYQMERYENNYYSHTSHETYVAAWGEIVKKAKSRTDISGIKSIPTKAKMLLTGLLVMADWIASCEEFFPLLEIYDCRVGADRLSVGMKTLLLQPYHVFNLTNMDEHGFSDRFGFKPNEIQNDVLQIANNTIDPGIMVIEAPMGQGKTEAALAVAEVESCAAGTGGIFFGLPTKATADAMFDRVKDWAEIISSDDQSSISLAHSSAGFNDSYKNLHTKTFDEDSTGISVNAWMVGKYKKLLPDFTIGTVDQFLFAALKRKFLMLLHLGLSGKTVIIDEVHSYDDYMSEFMKVMLSWLGAYKIPVILLSATLTKQKRKELVGAYTGRSEFADVDAYPAVTWSDGGNVYSSELSGLTINKKRIAVKKIDKAAANTIISDLLSGGGCAGIICDTVAHAQSTYAELKESLPTDFTIMLLHSRFLPEDRAELEKRIIALVGKNSTERNKIVIIGTQVLEQSLDIDFDVLFTEKCPIDLLFQRLGRLHRHMRSSRPEKVKTPACYIFEDEESCSGAKIYDEYIIRRTDEVLSEHNVIIIPDRIRPFTEDVYDLERGSDGPDKTEYIKRKDEMRRLAGAYLLPEADKCKFKGMLSEENTGNNEESVRYGINSINMIILKNNGQNYETFSGTVVSKKAIPDEKLTKELLVNRLSLRYDDELIRYEKELDSCLYDDIKLWKRNCYLENEHFLVSDENGYFRIGKHIYQYTKAMGWRKVE